MLWIGQQRVGIYCHVIMQERHHVWGKIQKPTETCATGAETNVHTGANTAPPSAAQPDTLPRFSVAAFSSPLPTPAPTRMKTREGLSSSLQDGWAASSTKNIAVFRNIYSMNTWIHALAANEHKKQDIQTHLLCLSKGWNTATSTPRLISTNLNC